MIRINSIDVKKVKWKESLILRVASLALLIQTQPLCAMDQEERGRKLEQAKIKKQEMLRKIEIARQPQLEKELQQKAQHGLGNNPFENLKKQVDEVLFEEKAHLDKLQILLKSRAFMKMEEKHNNEAKKYRKIVYSVTSAKVSPDIHQALAKKLLKDTSSILNDGSEIEAGFDELDEKINKIIVQKEAEYREERLKIARIRKQEVLLKIGKNKEEAHQRENKEEAHQRENKEEAHQQQLKPVFFQRDQREHAEKKDRLERLEQAKIKKQAMLLKINAANKEAEIYHNAQKRLQLISIEVDTSGVYNLQSLQRKVAQAGADIYGGNGKFTITKESAQGGFGVVYLDDTPYALKVSNGQSLKTFDAIKLGLSSDELEQFSVIEEIIAPKRDRFNFNICLPETAIRVKLNHSNCYYYENNFHNDWKPNNSWNIQIMKKIVPLLQMKDIILSAAKREQGGLDLINSLGRDLGQFQNCFIQKSNYFDGTYNTMVHGDFSYHNVLYTGCFNLIDNSSMGCGERTIFTDPICFIYSSVRLFGLMDKSNKKMDQDYKKSLLEAFYSGYMSPFDGPVKAEVKRCFREDKAHRFALKGTHFCNLGQNIGNDRYYGNRFNVIDYEKQFNFNIFDYERFNENCFASIEKDVIKGIK